MKKISQLRIYTIKEGKMDSWIEEWSEKIYPIRIRLGFQVDGAWTIEKENKFI